MALSVVCVAASTAQAGSFSVNGSGFSSSWERRASGSNATLRYGYNTFGVNEVYAHAGHSEYTHRAKISHGGSTYYGKMIGPNRTSSAQGKHKATSASYMCEW